MENIPNHEDCMKLLEEEGVQDHIREHCLGVAAIANHLTHLLNNAGMNLNESLVNAAALLHDIKRQENNHAVAGAQYLNSLGYMCVADIVARHMDIEQMEAAFPTESEIVFLADKLIIGDRRVTLKERFAVALDRHGKDEQALQSILRRQAQALKIMKKVESIIGCRLDEIRPVDRLKIESEMKEKRVNVKG